MATKKEALRYRFVETLWPHKLFRAGAILADSTNQADRVAGRNLESFAALVEKPFRFQTAAPGQERVGFRISIRPEIFAWSVSQTWNLVFGRILPAAMPR